MEGLVNEGRGLHRVHCHQEHVGHGRERAQHQREDEGGLLRAHGWCCDGLRDCWVTNIIVNHILEEHYLSIYFYSSIIQKCIYHMCSKCENSDWVFIMIGDGVL